jgi:hypothetical protein
MKNFVCLLALFFYFSAAFSQKTYFIYLQTEQQQPFYIKLGDKTYSSSASGYLILSKLIDSSYNVTVGFPQNKWPEQKFAVTLGGKDKGFLLKNFQDGSWGLFDLQTLSVQIAVVKTETNNNEANVSLFTLILSKAANDPSLREKPVLIKKEEQPVAAIVKEEIKKEEVKVEEKVLLDYKRSVITKKSESSTSEGFGLIFVDDYLNGVKDTISIVIPNPDIQRKAISDTQKEKSDAKKEVKSSAKSVLDDKSKNGILCLLPVAPSGKDYYLLKDLSQTLNC